MPENELEYAMARAARDPSALTPFYRCLLESRLIVLGSMDEKLAIETVKHAMGIFHPIFTSMDRLDAFGARGMTCFEIPGHVLFDSTRGAQFLINPRSPLAKTLTPEEIAWILDSFGDGGLTFFKSEVYPTKLVKALSILFTSRSQLQTARFVYVTRNRHTPQPHLVIGIEAEGDITGLAEEIFAAAEIAIPGQPMEVIQLNGMSDNNPLTRHLCDEPAFFKRTSRMPMTSALQRGNQNSVI